eukprot:gnl/MRDRNA2_/MRDRNA2_30751_c0_seq2.p1 gnl/MRDRNA2_/MRDRNA2_30751_c0~~gnl/MRDRNA2_/MRDRNA2_30751_c0_seq2.p1  ORF type:complete len:171 (-),score=24.84 gnl/MRDRNA2_/MRDRNA2_30751_c0_seq2:99-611(-)
MRIATVNILLAFILRAHTRELVSHLRPSQQVRSPMTFLRQPATRSFRMKLAATVKPDATKRLCVECDRRSALLRTAVPLGAMMPVLSASATPIADGEEDNKDALSVATRLGKLGGILLFADIVTGLILGKSVIGIIKTDGKGDGWKEKLTDQIMEKMKDAPEDDNQGPPK